MESSWMDQYINRSLDLNVGLNHFHCTSPGLLNANTMPVEREFKSRQEMGSSISLNSPNQMVQLNNGGLESELNRLNDENKRLNYELITMYSNYSTLRNHLFELMSSPESQKSLGSPVKKRKIGILESSLSEDSGIKLTKEDPKAKTSRVCVRTDPSDSSLVVKDGYQWRKYGQKVTRDNPSPRAYFRCSIAPSCQVKKQVQRSAEDRSILVATYHGEHNHGLPSQRDVISSCSSHYDQLPCSSSINPSRPMITLDLTRSGSLHTEVIESCKEMGSPQFHQLLAEQISSSLTKDPSFTSALATAVSGNIFRIPSVQKLADH